MKLKKVKDRGLFILVPSIMIFICVGFYFSHLFHSGYSQLDLSQNMKYLESEYNIRLVDLHSDGLTYGYSSMYIMGYNKLICGMYGFAYCCFSLGFLLSAVHTELNRNHYK